MFGVSLSEGIVVALISAFALIVVALLNRTRQHAKATRTQIENDHTTNFREENDERHEETLREFAELRSLVTSVASTVAVLVRHDGAQWKHIRDLEDTLFPEQAERLRNGHHPYAPTPPPAEELREGDRRRRDRRTGRDSDRPW